MDFEELVIHSRKNMSFYHYIKSFINQLRHDIRFVMSIRRTFRNYWLIIIKVARNQYPITANLKNGTELYFMNFHQLYSQLLGLTYDLSEDTVTIDDNIFYDGVKNAENLHDIFIKGEYAFLEVDKKFVFDIGANIADSSIYFAKKGALKVIAMEPDQGNLKIAKKNIHANKIESKIDLLSMGCGTDSNMEDNAETKIVSLETIIKAYPDKPMILKLDCEGCEYEAILNSTPSVLKNFSQIQIEYHYGYKNLKSKLEEAGFTVRYTEPRYFQLRNRGENIDHNLKFYDRIKRKDLKFYLGWIYASRHEI